MTHPIEACIGREAYLKIAQAYGGHAIRIRLPIPDPLEALLTPEQVAQLRAEFGGMSFWIPKE